MMEQNIASELELRVSGQVCELAASSITVGVHVVYLGMEVSPAQTPLPLTLRFWLRFVLISERMIACPITTPKLDCSSSVLLVLPSLPLPPPLQISNSVFPNHVVLCRSLCSSSVSSLALNHSCSPVLVVSH